MRFLWSQLLSEQSAGKHDLIMYLYFKTNIYMYFSVTPKLKMVEPSKNNIVDLTISDDEDTIKDDVSFMNCKLRPNHHSNVNAKETLRTVPSIDLPFGLLDLPKLNENNNLISPKTMPNANLSKPPVEIHPVATMPNTQKQLCPKELRIKLPKILSNESPKKESADVVAKPTVRYALRSRVAPQVNVEEKTPKNNSKRIGADQAKLKTFEHSWEWSSSATARQFDILHNFYPEPGPSHINYYEHMDLSVYYNRNNQTNIEPASTTAVKEVPKRINGAVKIGPRLKLKSCPKKTCVSIVINTLLRPPTFDYVLDAMPNYGIPYCSDSSMSISDTALGSSIEDFKSDVVPSRGWLAKRKGYETAIEKQTKKTAISNEGIILESLLRPPNFDEVLNGMCDFDIPFHTAIEPFYGNSNDATARKEIAHSTILHIPTQALNDVPDFLGDVVDGRGFIAIRNDLFKKMFGTEKILSHTDIRCKMASSMTCCKISPSKTAPTFADADQWTQIKSHNPIEIDLLADSPIKVTRIAPTITIGDEDEDGAVEIDIVLKMSQLTPNVVTDDNVIEASPTSKVESLHTNGRARHRDVIRVRNLLSPHQKSPSPILFESVVLPDRHNGLKTISSDEVICVDDDDDVVVCPDADTSQLFMAKRFAKETVNDGNVLVSKC